MDTFRYNLSSVAAEGLNGCFQQLIQKSCGYRNRNRFKRDAL
ncbi:MAG: transposase [Verrucomicrobia bacterium]|nr:transposase [Verrucomicrobiota bacterium]MBU4428259.1 transposase [Verrucomicrobiota bacterium]MCG2679558.1 transposase [Kiritimatiellia bacterium]